MFPQLGGSWGRGGEQVASVPRAIPATTGSLMSRPLVLSTWCTSSSNGMKLATCCLLLLRPWLCHLGTRPRCMRVWRIRTSIPSQRTTSSFATSCSFNRNTAPSGSTTSSQTSLSQTHSTTLAATFRDVFSTHQTFHLCRTRQSNGAKSLISASARSPSGECQGSKTCCSARCIHDISRRGLPINAPPKSYFVIPMNSSNMFAFGRVGVVSVCAWWRGVVCMWAFVGVVVFALLCLCVGVYPGSWQPGPSEPGEHSKSFQEIPRCSKDRSLNDKHLKCMRA